MLLGCEWVVFPLVQILYDSPTSIPYCIPLLSVDNVGTTPHHPAQSCHHIHHLNSSRLNGESQQVRIPVGKCCSTDVVATQHRVYILLAKAGQRYMTRLTQLPSCGVNTSRVTYR